MSAAAAAAEFSIGVIPEHVSTRCGICEVKVNLAYKRARVSRECRARAHAVTHSYNILTTGRDSSIRTRDREKRRECCAGTRALDKHLRSTRLTNLSSRNKLLYTHADDLSRQFAAAGNQSSDKNATEMSKISWLKLSLITRDTFPLFARLYLQRSFSD